MGKGFGSGGSGASSGGGGGAMSGALGPAKMAQAVVAHVGGVASGANIPAAKEFAAGQRNEAKLQGYAARYDGKTSLAAKNRVATSAPPISLGMAKERGKWNVWLKDGRHRLVAAKASGATRISATVTIYKGGREREVRTNVKI